MKKLCAVLMMIFIFTLTAVSASAADVTISLKPNASTVASGGTILLDMIYAPVELELAYGTMRVTYDKSLVEFVSCTAPSDKGASATPEEGDGYIVIPAQSGDDPYSTEKMATIEFKAIADGVANFVLSVETFVGDIYYEDYKDIAVQGATVTIGSTPDPEPVFTVDTTIGADAVTVKVANSNLVAAGKIYVATFDGDVLVDCQVKDIADETLTFSGLEGELSTAKIFVWDNNNVPIEYATTPAQ